MRVQIIPSPALKAIKEMWDVKLWKIYEVIKVKDDWYYIQVTQIFGNHAGEKAIIRMKSTEIQIVPDAV